MEACRPASDACKCRAIVVDAAYSDLHIDKFTPAAYDTLERFDVSGLAWVGVSILTPMYGILRSVGIAYHAA